jgi:serine/threonine-protein kinase RsbW
MLFLRAREMATIELYADFSHLKEIRAFVRDTALELGLDEWAAYDLLLAVDEVCSNVLKHGYGGRAGRLTVSVAAVAGGVQAVVRDWGMGFDPEAVPVPDLSVPLEQRTLGGLGLHLVRQTVDELRFAFGGASGNTVTMVKLLQEGGA